MLYTLFLGAAVYLDQLALMLVQEDVWAEAGCGQLLVGDGGEAGPHHGLQLVQLVPVVVVSGFMVQVLGI
jgi:hypothetical protein